MALITVELGLDDEHNQLNLLIAGTARGVDDVIQGLRVYPTASCTVVPAVVVSSVIYSPGVESHECRNLLVAEIACDNILIAAHLYF